MSACTGPHPSLPFTCFLKTGSKINLQGEVGDPTLQDLQILFYSGPLGGPLGSSYEPTSFGFQRGPGCHRTASPLRSPTEPSSGGSKCTGDRKEEIGHNLALKPKNPAKQKKGKPAS